MTIYWSEPVAQWLEVREEPFHVAPWAVVVGGYVRARYTKEAEAREVERRVADAFGALKGAT